MDKTLTVTGRFVDNMTAPIQQAAAGVQSAFNNMKGASSESTMTMGGLWDGFKNKVTGIWDEMTNGANKWASFFATTIVAKMGGDLIDLGAKFERFGVATKFLTGSTDEANKFADSVRNISKETMFNIDQIAELETRMVGNNKNVEASDRALRDLADAVAATGGGYSELEGATRAFIQVNSKGKLSLEELNRQFANANIPVMRLMAEAIVNDVDNPLRKYIETSTVATGVTQKQTKALEAAKGVIEDSGWKTKELADKLDKASKQFGDNSWQALKAKDALGDWNDKVTSATDSINKNTGAVSQNAKVTKLSVEQVLAKLQDPDILKSIPVAKGSEAILQAIERAYGGANKQLINTFDGQLSLLKDTVKLTALSFVGLDDHFQLVKGGLLDTLENALKPFLNFLNTNQQSISNFASKLLENKGVILGIAGAIFGLAIPALIGLGGALATPIVGFATIGTVLGILAGKFIDFGPTSPPANSFSQAMSKIGGSAEDQAKKLSDAEKATSDYKDKLFKHEKDVESANIAMSTAFSGITASLTGIKTSLSSVPGDTEATKISMLDLAKLVTQVARLFDLFGISVANTFFAVRETILKTQIAFEELTDKHSQYKIVLLNNLSELQKAHGNFQQDAVDRLAQYQSVLDGTAFTAESTFRDRLPAALSIAQAAVDASHGAMQSKIADTSKAAEVGFGNIGTHATTMSSTVKTQVDTVNTNLTAMSTMAKTDVPTAFSSMAKDTETHMSSMQTAISTHASFIDTLLDQIGKKAQETWNWLKKAATDFVAPGGQPRALFFAHGGIVPGEVGEPVPIIAHGGEKITPQTGSDVGSGSSGGPVNINFYGGLTVDSQDRVDELARTIARMLGRQNELSRYGAGY